MKKLLFAVVATAIITTGFAITNASASKCELQSDSVSSGPAFYSWCWLLIVRQDGTYGEYPGGALYRDGNIMYHDYNGEINRLQPNQRREYKGVNISSYKWMRWSGSDAYFVKES